MKAPKAGLAGRAKSLAELAQTVSRNVGHAKSADSSVVQVEKLDEAIRELEKLPEAAESLLSDLVRYRDILRQAAEEGL